MSGHLDFDPVLDLAITNGLVDEQQAQELLEEKKRSGKPMRRLLLDSEFVTENDLLGMMAANQGCEVVELTD
jgi:hypothetical protein